MRIYTDKRFLPEGLFPCPMLYPFWGLHSKLGEELDTGRYKEYLKSGPDFFEITTLKEAQIAVLPFNWEQVVPEVTRLRYDSGHYGKDDELIRLEIASAMRLAKELAAEAVSANIPLVVFFVDDNETLTVPLDNAYTFRPSLLNSRRQPHEFAMPVWMRDEVESAHGGEVPLRSKKAKPTVGFCGIPWWEQQGIRSRLKRRLSSVPMLSRMALQAGVDLQVKGGQRVRAQALNLLSRNVGIKPNFIFRKGWFNGAFEGGLNISLLQKSRVEFFDNMFGSDYILCARGCGNFSIRFYETLSCGRIPIFINTDCALPYERFIDWQQYCVWIEEEDLPYLPDRVIEFHERLSEREFKDRQRACRQLWLEWLSPQGFFKNFYRHFSSPEEIQTPVESLT